MKWQVTIEVSQTNQPSRWGSMTVVVVETNYDPLLHPNYRDALARLVTAGMKGSGRFRIRETWEALE